MKNILPTCRVLMVTLLILSSIGVPGFAQEITIPDPHLNAVIRATIQKTDGPLTQEDMLGLTNLSAIFQSITNLEGLDAAHNLIALQLDDNKVTRVSFPDGLTHLTNLKFLDMGGNPISELILSGTLTNLDRIRIEDAALTNLFLPEGLTRLTEIRVGFNRLTSLRVPADMTNLELLSVYQNQLTNVVVPPNLPALREINLDGNSLTSFQVPAGLAKLESLIVSGNHLSNFSLREEMTNLTYLRLNDNQLTSLTIPSTLKKLSLLTLDRNQLTNLTLPPDLTNLQALSMEGNPLRTFVLAEPLATGALASLVSTLRDEGVSVFTYPTEISLVGRESGQTGQFEITLSGPPGRYSVLVSTNLSEWRELGEATNTVGSIVFTDSEGPVFFQKFFRTQVLH
jgi:internalin A